MSWKQQNEGGKVLGLVLSAVIVFAGCVAAPASFHRTSSAASADGIVPSVMVGAGTEQQEETDAPDAWENPDSDVSDPDTGASGEVGTEEVRSSRVRNQTSMWISSIAEGLDNLSEAGNVEQPSDSSGAQVLEAASSVGRDAEKLIAENRKMSDTDYTTLLNIVEAECTGGDEKSKLLVANVILNRVADEHFPDTVYDVVWQKIGGTAQFSPTQDGRMGTLTVSGSTRSAVRRAVSGEDISDGALFFMARASSSRENVDWFDKTLTYLFSYGGHDFYRFHG